MCPWLGRGVCPWLGRGVCPWLGLGAVCPVGAWAAATDGPTAEDRPGEVHGDRVAVQRWWHHDDGDGRERTPWAAARGWLGLGVCPWLGGFYGAGWRTSNAASWAAL